MADHQGAIISEKLKLLKNSSLKTEGNQTLVGVLNTDVSFSGSAVGVLAYSVKSTAIPRARRVFGFSYGARQVS